MKTFQFLSRYITLLFFMAIAVAFASCEDNGNDGGIPEIQYVRITDPAKADSTFIDAFPGQMIVIVGKNLTGIQKIFINNQEIGFNKNLGTATDIIITIPSDIILKGINPELPDEIRIETDHGSATYRFHVYSPAPVISGISLTYPAAAGEKLRILGSNFYEIQKIVFEGESGKSIEVSDYTVSKEYNQIEFAIPDGIEDGLLAVYCYTSTASIEFAVNAKQPIIYSLSQDMPVVGDLAYITGSYFIGVIRLNINGEFDIFRENLEISESADTIYFRLPQAPTKNGVITVSAAGGEASSSFVFYPIENVILNYDGIGWYSWGDNNEPVTADGSKPPYLSTGVCYRLFGVPENPWWWGNLVNGCVIPPTSVISASTPIENLRFRFECYMEKPVEPAWFTVAFNGIEMGDYVPRDIKTGQSVTGKWISCELPLSSFTDAADYGAFAVMGNSEVAIYTKGNPDNMSEMIDIFFDNFRIVDTTE
jgi:hypothetical protein